MKHNKVIITIFFLLTIAYPLSAQIVINGVISDAETGEVIQNAIVKVRDINSNENSIISYAVSDREGKYRLNFRTDKEKIVLEFSLLGYRTEKRTIDAKTAIINQKLSFSSEILKEVTIKAPSISSQGDTIHYNVSAFITKSDKNIEDILRKLPGITVQQTGQIEYQGKPINKFYIEGLDMLEGRYSLATKNIAASEITSVQVYENHQPVRLLKNIEFSENAALNIKLKNNKMIRPIGNMLAGGGYDTDKGLYRGELFGFIANKKRQILFTAKGNNCGIETFNELITHYGTQNIDIKAGNYIMHMPFTVPNLIDRRTNKSKNITSSINSIKKIDEQTNFNLNFFYSQKQKEYKRESISSYFSGDSTIVIQENINARNTINDLSGMAIYEKNANSFYIRNATNTALSVGKTNVNAFAIANNHQDYNIREIAFNNNLSLIWRKNNNVYNLQSLIRGGFMPENRLDIFNSDLQRLVQQTNKGRSFDTKTTTSFIKGFDAYSNLYIDIDLATEYDRIETHLDSTFQEKKSQNDNHGYKITSTLTPAYSFSKDRFQIKIDVPLQYIHIRYKDEIYKTNFTYSKPRINSGMRAKYTISPALSARASCRLNHSVGDILSFVENPIQVSYNRIKYGESGILANRKNITASIGYDYRNTMNGLFSSFSANIGRIKKNIIKGNNISNNGTITTLSEGSINYSDNYSTNFYFAKNFHSLKTTFALNATYTYSINEKIRQDQRIFYHNKFIFLLPSINLRAIRWLSFRVQSPIQFFSQKIDAIAPNPKSEKMDWAIDADISILPIDNVEVYYSLVYQNNSCENKNREQLCFMDAGIRYQPTQKMELELSIQNITNIQHYTTTNYLETDIFTTSYYLRPINGLLTLKYSF